jgi:uncharacterized protein YbjT (DUF2867 family)
MNSLDVNELETGMICVTTPTGNIGSQVLHNLLAAGESVRVVARDPAKLPPEIRDRIEVIQGSSDDIRVLLDAMDGADALFWCVPPPFRASDPMAHYLHFTAAACGAIKTMKIKHVVGISSLGRGVARNAGPISYAHAMDATIEKTGVAYKALWNPGFMENTLRQAEAIQRTGILLQPGAPDVKNPLVAVRDIASVAARLLHDRSWSGQGGVAVLGPENLSRNDMAAILTEVLGRPVHSQEANEADYKAGLIRSGASEPFAQGLVDMRKAISKGLYNIEIRTAENTTPTTFRQWCEEVLKPTLAG